MLDLVGYLIVLALEVGAGTVGLTLMVVADGASIRERTHDTIMVPQIPLVFSAHLLLLIALWGGVNTLRSLMAWL